MAFRYRRPASEYGKCLRCECVLTDSNWSKSQQSYRRFMCMPCYSAKEFGEKWREIEYQETLSNHVDLLDWAENNMNWKDVCQAAFQVSPGKVDYQEGWVNGPKKVVEG